MPQLLIGGSVRHQQPPLVPDGGASDEPAAGYGGVDDRDVIDQFRFEHAVEVFGSSDSYETVGVREGGEYSDLIGVFEGASHGHFVGWLLV
mmetsp:Transcript_20083/g.24611  ORF Transcript_20083/g.24611 Transcript_20083/m.24611 type:complete len:91 (+) Transcript_20083:977-1249(+)